MRISKRTKENPKRGTGIWGFTWRHVGETPPWEPQRLWASTQYYYYTARLSRDGVVRFIGRFYFYDALLACSWLALSLLANNQNYN